MKKASALFLAILMATFSLAGCFGQDDEEKEENDEVKTLEDWDVYYVDTADGLPNCNSDTLGRLYYVGSSQSFEVCLSSGWSFIDLRGNDGEPGPAGQDANESRLNDLTFRVDLAQAELMALDNADENFSSTLDLLVDEINSLQDQIDDLENGISNYITEIKDGDCGEDGWGSEIVSGHDVSGDGTLTDDESEASIEICSELVNTPYIVRDTGIPTSFRIMEFGDDLIFGSENCLVRYEIKTETLTNLICLNETVSPTFPNYVQREGGNDLLFFVMSTNDHGTELWVTDGTKTGTHEFNINKQEDAWFGGELGAFSSIYAENFAVLDEKLYFLATDGVNDTQLWRSDGTESGTFAVSDSSPSNSWNAYLTPFNGNLLFMWYDPSDSETVKLLSMDGQSENISLVKNVGGGRLTEFNNKVYFNGNSFDGAGWELWITDGTSAGTNMVSDINQGAGSSSPQQFTISDNYLWFMAENDTGQFLHFLDKNGDITELPYGYGYSVQLIWTEGDFLVLSQNKTLFRLTSTSTVVQTLLQDLGSVNSVIYFKGDHLGNRYFFVYNPFSIQLYSYGETGKPTIVKSECGGIVTGNTAIVHEYGLFMSISPDDCIDGEYHSNRLNTLHTTVIIDTSVSYS